jgi:hypothetical protein
VARAEGDHDRAAGLYRASLDLARQEGDAYEAARGLDGLAALALARGHPREAAGLLGAADALRQAIGAAVRPVDRADHARIREALGEAFPAAWAEGHGRPLDEVLAGLGPAPGGSGPGPAGAGPDPAPAGAADRPPVR